jgi:hypothetical protein
VTEELTPSQSLLVWCLLANQGVVKQKDVAPAVKKVDREILVRTKLLHVTKQGNSFFLRLEDDGWAWAVAHLRANLPPAYNVLQGFLIRLDEHLRKADITLADFIGPAPEPPEAQSRSEKRPKTSRAQEAESRRAKLKITEYEPKDRSTKKQPAHKPSSRKRKTGEQIPIPNPPPDVAEVRREIERAYLKVTKGRKGVDARLSEVRAHLSYLSRESV